ncbi:MAG: PadR family transcriptional regulator [Candidatus Aminicenantes bacterium]|nr:PadR family transcriptional regulator [Candidatus Aminicenantes bacterium]
MKLLSRSEELVLLAVWRLRGNAYTLSILKRLSEITGYEWQVGAVYVPLEKLVKKQYLRKYAGKPTAERGGRRKSLYDLTPLGRKALKDIKDVQEAAWADLPEIA